MKFYFAGAIRGGRDRVDTYIKINELLEKYGEVLDKHVANPNVYSMEADKTPEEIYTRDVNWIEESDLLIAEISTPSLGVGYELAYAERLHKKIIILGDNNIKLSSMITGNKNFELIAYDNEQDLLEKLDNRLKSL